MRLPFYGGDIDTAAFEQESICLFIAYLRSQAMSTLQPLDETFFITAK